MHLTRALASLAASLALGACVAVPPPGPSVMILPGKDKSLAAFQQDQSICQQHAIAHTGYGGPSEPGPRNSPGASAVGAMPIGSGASIDNAAMLPGTEPPDEISYDQCMAARGDTVRMAPMAGYYPGYSSAYLYGGGLPYAYLDPYGYGFPYAYPSYGGFYDGWGWGGWYGGGRGWGGFHGRGFHGGGFRGGGMGRGGGGGGHR